jgi:hypothetical protein
MRKIAVLLLLLVGLSALGMGVKYLSLAEFTPVHAAIVGRSWWQLDAGIQSLILGMLRIMGAGFVGGGISLLCLAHRAGKQERWPAWAAPLISVSVWGPTLYVAMQHRAANPNVDTPVGITALLLVMVAAASAILWFVNDPRRLQASKFSADVSFAAAPLDQGQGKSG